jgi:hypothetical protein
VARLIEARLLLHLARQAQGLKARQMLGHAEQSRGQAFGAHVVATFPHPHDHLLGCQSIGTGTLLHAFLALQAGCMHQARQTLAMQPSHEARISVKSFPRSARLAAA